MKKGNLILFAAALAAGACVAVKMLASESPVTETPAGQEGKERDNAGTADAPTDGDDTVAYPLKNKLTHQNAETGETTYIFELETPSGVKEMTVTWAHYETYYIGDEVICRETPNGLEVV